MRSMRKAVLLFIAATVTAAACDEFPQDPEFVAGQIDVDIERVNWPDHVVLEDGVTLEVQVLDPEDRVILDPPLNWQEVSDGAAELSGSGALQRTVTGNGLGWAKVELTLEGEIFRAPPHRDSIPVVLGGITLAAPTQDTVMTSLEDTIVVDGFGLTATGTPVNGSNLTWRTSGLGYVEFDELIGATGDEVRIIAKTEGVDTLYVTHPLCAGECEPFILVDVAQVADTVAMEPTQDTMVAEDTVRFVAVGRDARRFDVGSEVFTWTSTNEDVVTVDADGLVTADTVGSAMIIATARSGKADTTAVQVLQSGVIQVQLTDAPADNLESAVLYLGGVYVMDNQATRGRRYILQDDFNIDLLTLTDTVEVLGSRRVPVGTYGNLFLEVDSAKLTLRSGLTFEDGETTLVLTPPEAELDSVLAAVDGSPTVAEGDSVRILVDFDVDQSFPMSEPLDGIIADVAFSPTTRTLKKEDGAFVDGSVTSATAEVNSLTLRAVRTDLPGDTVYARTDLEGAYGFRYLIPGDYTVSIPAAPACHLSSPATRLVSLAPGQRLTANDFTLNLVSVDSVKPSPAEDTINAIGYQTQLGAKAYDDDVELVGLAFEFASLNPDVATVSRTGLVTAVATGTALIEITSCGQSTTATVLVRQIPASVTVEPATAEVEAGGTQQFTASLKDSAGVAIPGGSFDWSSSDPAVATVDASGLATAIRSGSTEITATESTLTPPLMGSATFSVALGPSVLIDVGGSFSCAMTQSSEIACWGESWGGQLGFFESGQKVPYRPQTIPLPTATWVDLSVGLNHACALNTSGEIYCWGNGSWGELGNGQFNNQANPTLVDAPAGVTFTEVVAGAESTCAIGDDSVTYCWGYGGNGELGNGEYQTYAAPQALLAFGDAVFTSLAASDNAVCGLNASGIAYCWGSDNVGELGGGNFTNSNTPVEVDMSGPGSFVSLTAGNQHFCGLTSAGAAWCWGRGWENQLGDGSHEIQGTPVLVTGGRTFTHLAAGRQTTCGLIASGEAYCWGASYYGQFGTPELPGSSQVAPAVTGLTLESMSAHNSTFCAITTSGEPYCWGWEEVGNTGTGSRAVTNIPEAVSLPSTVLAAEVAADGEGACALLSSNALYCWGQKLHWSGEDLVRTATPTAVTLPAGINFVGMTYGQMHVCVIADDGTTFCRGNNDWGQLGDGTTNWSGGSWVQVNVPEGVTFSSIDAGRAHTCAMATDSSMWCWGANYHGALGNGNMPMAEASPVKVLLPAGRTWESMSVGYEQTCALATSGEVYCWGYGEHGELGDGSYTNTDLPREVSGSALYTQVAAGGQFTCALDTAGAAWCWGRDWDGRLGRNGAGDSGVPVQVQGGYVFTSLFATPRGNACGILSDGSALCWGTNYSGNIAVGDFDYTPVPTAAFSGLLLTDFTGGSDTSCALDDTGTLYCVGSHSVGTTGLGEFGYELVPVKVGGSGS